MMNKINDFLLIRHSASLVLPPVGTTKAEPYHQQNKWLAFCSSFSIHRFFLDGSPKTVLFRGLHLHASTWK
jgi:hypothetical protein